MREHPPPAGGAVRDSGPRLPLDGRAPAAQRSIEIHGAREHNLKNVDVNLGLNQFTVITGVSGSGKSTLAFDILFAEGQRRYLESLNAYARQFVQPASRPDVDAIFGIPPTVAIEQRTSRGGHKSTVATLTEIYHFLRLLYVKLGVQYCPVCEARIEPQSADAIAARLLKEYRGRNITLLAPLIVARKGLYTALAKWARGKGFAHLRVDGSLLPTAKWPRLDRFVEHNIELPIATLNVERRPRGRAASGVGRGPAAWPRRGARQLRSGCGASVFSTKRACPNCGTGFPELDPRLFSFNSKHGWCKTCFGTGLQLAAIRCRAERRGIAVARISRRTVRDLPRLRRSTSQSGGAARHVPRAVDRRTLEPARAGILGGAADPQAGRARTRHRPRFAGRARRPDRAFSATSGSAICN